MVESKSIDVIHLGGISVGYLLSEPFNPANPTIVLVNSFSTSVELYAPWFRKSELTSKINLLAIELLGHGKTRAHKTEHWTYWDTAIMNIQVLDALKIETAYILGTSQGGFVCVRMALLAPKRINGLILLGTCMDREGPEIVANGCWDGLAIGAQMIAGISTYQDNFTLDPSFTPTVMGLGLGNHVTPELVEHWSKILSANYGGDDGRKRLRMASICLRDRDGLHSRLRDVICPILWMQGTADQVYSLKQAEIEFELFTNVKSKEFKAVENGGHFLSATNPQEVESAMLNFVCK